MGAGTFIGILIGTIMGGALVTLPYGTVMIATMLCVFGFASWMVSFMIPRTMRGDPSLKIDWNPLTATRPLIRNAISNPKIARAILGISWFWFVGAIFLSMLPNYVKDVLNGTPALVTFLLTLFTVGIATGSFLCNRLLHGNIDTRFVPVAYLIMAVAMADLYNLRLTGDANGAAVTLMDFLANRQGMAITALFLIMSIAGGVAMVPLYATLQAKSDEKKRARIIAANNITNAFFMVMSSLFTMAMIKAGYQILHIFAATAAMTFITAIYFFERLPYRLFGAILRLAFSALYKVRLNGLPNLAQLRGQSAIYIVNHTSLIDGLLLAAFLPEHPVIAANAAMRKTLGMKLYHLFAGHPPVDPADPLTIKHIVNMLKSGRSVVMFPEGRPTQTGVLMKIYETPGVIANLAKVSVVPVRINGAQHTPYSRLQGKVRLKMFPRITLTILAPVMLKSSVSMSSRQRRQAFGDQLYAIMANMMFGSCDIDQTLYEAFLDAKSLQRSKTPIIEDIDRAPRTYGQLTVISRVLGRQLAKVSKPRENVGVMLPNGVGIVSVILSLLAFGRTVALLNFTAGLTNLKSACLAANITTIITSRKFVKVLDLGPVIKELGQSVTFVYAEDIRAKIGLKDKIRGLLEAPVASFLYKKLGVLPDDPAVVLFTSGSESAPKGVVLSHKNILANRYQIGTYIELYANDTLFNALPVFHSFGLTVGMFLPLLTGVKAFLYPSPLHYRIIPELIYETNASILISTDTFLANYARNAHPYDFSSLRLVVAGGEKLKKETRRLWFEKFGIRILEGYGVTETSPVLAINTPMHFKIGTVGHLVAGMDYRLRPIEGIARGGSLVVRGPNVMLGYLKASRPGVLQPPYSGWYDTGDVVDIDEQGFIRIIGRVKRFAKIGGEMVSLGAVETYIQSAYPGRAIGAVTAPDPRKGEQIVLFTDDPNITREICVELAQKHGVPELLIPRQVVALAPMPLLGTGKIDYVRLNQIAQNHFNPNGAD